MVWYQIFSRCSHIYWVPVLKLSFQLIKNVPRNICLRQRSRLEENIIPHFPSQLIRSAIKKIKLQLSNHSNDFYQFPFCGISSESTLLLTGLVLGIPGYVKFQPLFVLMLYVPNNNFSDMSGWLPVFLSWTSTTKCLAQGHNTVTPPVVSFELATPQSPLKYSSNWATALRKYHQFI